MKIILINLLILLLAGSAIAVDLDNVIKPEKGQPINIKSNNLIIKNNKNLAIFKTNVRVRQGQMLMLADEVRLYSDYSEKTKKSSLKQLEAKGNVDFKSADSTVRSDFASYDVQTGILNLKGNVRMADAESSLEGKVFTYNAKTGTSQIRNSLPSDTVKYGSKAAEGGRVRAVFVPGEGIKSVTMPSDALDGYKQQKKQQQKEAE